MIANAEPASMHDFIRAHTARARPPLVPEIALYLATEITPIWQATEAWLDRAGLSPPFWAFTWPGSQVLARYILDAPYRVAGRRVLDFAAGNGLAAIACAMAGAATIEAAEIDDLAIQAIHLNAETNGVTIKTLARDIVGEPNRWDLILCGDICYEAPMTNHILPWLHELAAEAEVWIADPGRAYLPKTGFTQLATFTVPTSLELEDHAIRQTRLLKLDTLENTLR